MGYVDQTLLPGEKVLHRTSLHWIMFLKPFFWLGLFGVLWISGRVMNNGVIGWIGFSAFCLVSLFIGLCAIDFLTSEFAVTNKRVVIKVGFISRQTVEMMLKKVEGLSVDQSILGRILGYGTLLVTGTGGVIQPFPGISNPIEFRRQVTGAVSE